MATQPYISLYKTLDKEITPPEWPIDVRIVPFDPASHACDAHRLLVEAYTEGGGGIGSFEDWWTSLSTDSEYDQSLLFVVQNDQLQLVGVAQCWISGHVKDIGVQKDWRRRGIGEAILRHAFLVFQKRGLHQVSLKVQMDNPSGAETLYRRIGMAPVESEAQLLASARQPGGERKLFET